MLPQVATAFHAGSKIAEQAMAERSASKQRRFVRQQLRNRYQWTAQDMEKAGLNRILAVGGNPPVHGGSAPHASGFNAMQAIQQGAQYKLLDTQQKHSANDLRLKERTTDEILDPKNKELFDAHVKKEVGLSAPVKDTQYIIDAITKFLDSRESSTVADLIKAGAYTAVGAILLKKLGLIRAMMSLKNVPKAIREKIEKGMKEKPAPKGKPKNSKLFD